MLLDYEKQIFADLMEHDGLLIMAKSLGVQRILENMLKPFCHPASLVLVLNTSGYEEQYFIEKMREDGVEQVPKIINSEIGRDDRVEVYMSGGVLFVSSRILVVDLLTDKTPCHLISGILVNNAHRVGEAGLESFILRLFRQKNKTGFIKAFSDNPVSFTNGYCQVEKVMKSLFLRKLFLYPRFHAGVMATLERHEPEVVELGVPCSQSMKACQMSLLELINLCIKELKLCNPGLDLEEVTYENLITKAFDMMVRVQLDPIWHQLSSKTKQLVSDLKTLRELLKYLTQFDCVTFFSMVRSLKSSEKEFKGNVGWLFTDAADKLFLCAKERVYGSIEQQAKLTDKTAEIQAQLSETNPKWRALTEVLNEIEEANKIDTTPGRVLIAVNSSHTCNQLRRYLQRGAQDVMTNLIKKLDQPKEPTESSKGNQKEGKVKPQAKKGKAKQEVSNDQVTLTQLARGGKKSKKSVKATENTNERADDDANRLDELAVDADGNDEEDDIDESICVIDTEDAFQPFTSSQTTVLLALQATTDAYCLTRVLEALQPRYVILYDVDISYVRQIEVYKACQPGLPLRVYFLVFTGSSEEQKFLTSIRKEKDSFEQLIKTKATMVIPENRDGKLEEDKDHEGGMMPANMTTAGSSRKGGIQSKSAQRRKVIVDMREFRSDLPFLVHKLDIDLEPVTLEVGDYILTPDICIERKSISDLIGSLNNGRLYNQCVAMSRYYKRPVLLIEFDPTKPFTLQKNFNLQQEISINDIQSRLSLLTLHFPKLRILWCQSAYATADLFKDLKQDADEPDVSKALTVTADEASGRDSKYNVIPYDFLMKIPNITIKNVRQILDKVKNMTELSELKAEELTEIIGNQRFAEYIVEFINKEYVPEVKDSEKSVVTMTIASKLKSAHRKAGVASKQTFAAKPK